MKRILCLILTLLLLVPAAYADETDMVFRLDSPTGQVGDTVTVVGSVQNAPKCASFRIIFTYDDTVLEVVSGKKEKAKGLFMINTDTEYQGKAAVNALAADASKALEGDMDLFSVTFKIIGETNGNGGTPLEVVTEEFFTNELAQIHPTIEAGRVYVGSDVPGGSEEEPETPDTDTDPDTNGDTPSTTPDTNGDQTDGESNTTTPDNSDPSGDSSADTPAATTPEDSKTEDKTPTGSWLVGEEMDEVVHMQENGDATTYLPEFVETPEVGKVTDVILKDKDTQEEVGSIKVEKQEDGSLEVVEQDLPAADEDEKSGVPGWVWTVIGVAVVAAAAIAVGTVLVVRKKKEEAPAEEAQEESASHEE